VTDPEIDITRAEMRELHQLFALANSMFADRPGWDDDHVLRALARDVVFVAHERSLPVGYVALQPQREGAFLVEQVLVAPGDREEGVARRLLAYAEGYAIAHGASALRVVVEEDNLAARSLYRQLGFCPLEQELFELVLPLSA
jgi:ribosomal protein S18 acetylase RimI-like enzyme